MPAIAKTGPNVQPADNATRGAAYGPWQNENGSQINIVPTDRILEVRDMDMRFEDAGREEEYGWTGSRAAISTSTVL